MTNDELQKSVALQLGQVGAAPVLFVGSGMSRRYLDIPVWGELLRHFAGFTSKEFDFYRIKANSHWPTVASLIADDFWEVWWSDAQFSESRRAVSSTVASKADVLKYEIAKYVSRFSSSAAPAHLQDELEVLRTGVVESIITTNWDCHLEHLFPEFSVFIGQEEMLFSRFHGAGEIYKIHGCCSLHAGIVLTSEDYAGFESKNVYLASKLLTLFVDFPIVFLGYSLTDEYILKMLDAIVSGISTGALEKLQGRLIFVEYDPSCTAPTIRQAFRNVGNVNLPYTEIRARDYLPIYKAFASIRRTYSAKVLRQLKSHVYELVRSVAPSGQLVVVGMEDAASEDVEVVIGVGIIEKISSHGYRSLTSYELAQHCLVGLPDKLDYSQIVKVTLPELIKGKRNWVPVRRFAQAVPKNDWPDAVKSGMRKTVDDYSKGDRTGRQIRERVSIASIVARRTDRVSGEVHHQACMSEILECARRLDPSDLRQFLVTNIANLGLSGVLVDSPLRSTFMKLVCLLDLLEFPDTGLR